MASKSMAGNNGSGRQNAHASLLYRDTGLLGRVLRDELDERVSRIVVDDRIITSKC